MSWSGSISLRTLEMGYELARANPNGWKILLARLLPAETPLTVLADLKQKRISVQDQVREFVRLTGLSRRTFYNYRNRLREDSAQSASCKSLGGVRRG